MTYMQFEGDLARRLWHYVKNDLDLLQHARELDSLTGLALRKAELELITFLALAGFGEEDVIKRRGVRRREYFAALSEINPDIFYLRYAREEIDIHIDLGTEQHELNLGRACGYTTLVPLTQIGYWEYMSNKVSAFQFEERHITRPGDVPAKPCYVYGEGAFHISAYANRHHYPEGVTAVRASNDRQPEWSLVRQLKEHVKRFLPELILAEDGRVLRTEPEGRIPAFLFADNGVMAKAWIDRGFTEPPAPFPRNGMAGYPRYALDLADYNREDVDEKRKETIGNLMASYLDVREEPDERQDPLKAMMSEPFPDEFKKNVFANAALLHLYSRDGAKPFQGMRVVCILHFLRDLVPFFEALVLLGAKPEKVTFFYKRYPYPQRVTVGEYLRGRGAIVDSLEGLEAWLGAQEQAGVSEPLIVIEDGGYITPRLLSGDLPRLRARTRLVVEQTTRGKEKIRKAVDEMKGAVPEFPILSVASCVLKAKIEPPHIADSFLQNLRNLLPDRMVAGSSCGLFGFGSIGESIAEVMRNAGARITVYDVNSLNLIKAKQRGYDTANSTGELLRNRAWVVGCTGTTSIAESDIYDLSDQSYLVSASSDQIEFAVDALSHHSISSEDFFYHGKFVGSKFELQGTARKRIFLVANGFPINFWGMNSMPDPVGDLIMTVLLLSAWDGLKAEPRGVDGATVDKIVEERKLAFWFQKKY